MDEGPFGAIRAVLRAIPPGRVVSYGDAAALAGFPRGARTVVWVLHTTSGLPWHRVVRKSGQIALSDPAARDLQRQLLEAEGVEVRDGCVDMVRYAWKPSGAV